MDNMDESGSLEQPLYHYTSIEVFHNITMHSKALWASCVSYMNDAEEFTFAADLLLKTLNERIINAIGDELKNLEILHPFILAMVESKTAAYFVFSLSAKQSQLSQWRSYTPHGSGVSISFSPQKIRDLTISNNFSLVRCLYTEKEQVGWINNVLNDSLAILQAKWSHLRPPNNDSKLEKISLIKNLIQDIGRCLVRIKNIDFSEEDEWRLVSNLYESLEEGVDYKVANGMLVPYISIDLLKKPYFETVLLGPSPHSHLSANSLDSFIKKHGVAKNCMFSKIPYREW